VPFHGAGQSQPHWPLTVPPLEHERTQSTHASTHVR
jgi:hypothetical protein